MPADGRLKVSTGAQTHAQARTRTPRGERCKDDPVKCGTHCGGIRIAPGTEGVGKGMSIYIGYTQGPVIRRGLRLFRIMFERFELFMIVEQVPV